MMKSRLLQATRMVAYLRNFQTLAQKQQRDYSSKVSPQDVIATTISEESTTETKIPEREIHLLGPKDLRAPLPGDVGIGHFYIQQSVFKPADNDLQKEHKNLFELLEKATKEERQLAILEQFVPENQTYFPNLDLELAAQICPWLVKKDMCDLFPDRNIMFEDLTVITVCHKTKNSMSAWSEDAAEERTTLIEEFIKASDQICHTLKEVGYWADFIDPTSGRPYLGEYTNATFYETDERYRYFGLKIEDLGCCKVISHALWGTNTFVGCIFTNAPINSEQINSLLKPNK